MRLVRAMLAAATMIAAGSAVAALSADYRFQNTMASTVAGAPALVDVGPTPNAFAVETVDGANRTVLAFQMSNGVRLSPTTAVTGGAVYTIVLLARLADVSGYRKYVDYKDGSLDDGLYNYSGSLDFYDYVTGAGAPIAAGAWRQLVVTRDGSGTVTGYVDGVEQFSFADGTGAGVVGAANALRFFIDDSETTGEDSAGAVARIRVYDQALTPAEVAALDREPESPAAVPTLSEAALLALALLVGLLAWPALRGRRAIP